MSFSPSTKLINRIPHKELYKSPFRQCHSPVANRESVNENCLGESPSWRNAYKKRCFDEFKKSRQKLINRFRNFQIDSDKKTKFKDYLEEELEKICLLEAQTESISIDDAIEMYKQIQEELIPISFGDLSDEQIEELLKSQEMEDKMNQENILYVSMNKISQVFCPICQKEFLKQEYPTIYCQNVVNNNCNFKIDCQETNLDLEKLAVRLEDAMRQHQCNEIPYFQFKTKNSMDKNDLILFNQFSSSPNNSCFLLMSCDNCCFLQSII